LDKDDQNVSKPYTGLISFFATQTFPPKEVIFLDEFQTKLG